MLSLREIINDERECSVRGAPSGQSCKMPEGRDLKRCSNVRVSVQRRFPSVTSSINVPRTKSLKAEPSASGVSGLNSVTAWTPRSSSRHAENETFPGNFWNSAKSTEKSTGTAGPIHIPTT